MEQRGRPQNVTNLLHILTARPWLSTLNFDAGATQTAFTEYWHAVEAADERVERLTKALVRRSRVGVSSR